VEKLNRNFLWMAAANITGSIFNTAIFIYLARTLAVEAFGYLSYATTIVLYLVNFVDLGLSTYGVREIARDRSRLEELVSNIVSFRFLAAAVFSTVFILLVSLSSNAMVLKILMAECALWLFLWALSTEWAFQGVEKMHMVFISLFTSGLLQLSLTCTLIKGPQDLLKFPIIIFAGAIPIITVYLKKLNFRPGLLKPDMKNMRIYLSSSLVIWSISIFVQIYNGIDIIILGVLRSAEEVGCFTIARRTVGGLALLMVFLANATLPRLSSTFQDDLEAFSHATRRFLRLSVCVVILIFLPLIFFSRPLISLAVGGEYLSAALPLQILMLGLILVIFNLPFSTGLIAAGMEVEVLKQTFASAVLNIVSNFILIGKYGMIGAAISFFLAESLAIIWILRLYSRKIGTSVIKCI